MTTTDKSGSSQNLPSDVPLRLLLISPRFWPIAGTRELLSTAFAESLADLGHEVTVLTGKTTRTWPDEYLFGKVQVVRLPVQRDGLLESWRRIRRKRPWIDGLNRWLAGRSGEFDFSIVIPGLDDPASTLECLQRIELPAVIRCDDACPPVLAEQFGTGSICRVNSSATADNGQFDRQIPDGVIGPGPVRFSRLQIRQSLNAAHPLFELQEGALLALCAANLDRESGVFDLVEAWHKLLNRYPSARLWLTGDGREGFQVFQRVRELGMEHSVILPGSFDDIRDIVQAADAVILPGNSVNPDCYCRMAIATGVPLIYSVANRSMQTLVASVADPNPGQRATSKATGNVAAPRVTRLAFEDSRAGLASTLLDWAEATSGTAEVTETTDPSDLSDGGALNSIEKMARQYVSAGISLLNHQTSKAS